MSIAHDKPKRPHSSGVQCAYFILKLAYNPISDPNAIFGTDTMTIVEMII